MNKSQILFKRAMLLSFTFLFLTVSYSAILAAGEVDPTFNAAVQDTIAGDVRKIVQLPDGKLLVGGNFSIAGNSTHSNVARFNNDGTVDPTFNPPDFYGLINGQLSLVSSSISAIAQQADGKILVGGDFYQVGNQIKPGIARLNADGSLDNSFGSSLPPNNSVKPIVYDIKVQSDNKILIGGNYLTVQEGIGYVGLARLNTNGSFDSSFSKKFGMVNSLVIQPDGKIVYGITTPFQSVVSRINSDGTNDNTFLEATFTNGSNSVIIYKLTLQTDGKILVGGSFSISGSSLKNLVRLTTNGVVDPSFNVSGTGTYGGSSNLGSVRDIAILTDGKIVIGGDFGGYNNTFRIKNARLNPDGTLDNTFFYNFGNFPVIYAVTPLNDGSFIFGFSGYITDVQSSNKLLRFTTSGDADTNFQGAVYQLGVVYQVASAPNGKVLLGGVFIKVNGIIRMNVAQLNSDGSVDTGFTANITGRVATVASQSDNKALVGGAITQINGSPRLAVARLNFDGSLDTGFQTTLTNGSVEKLLVLPNGKILIAGNFRLSNYNFDLSVARLNTDGSTDTTFVESPVNNPGSAFAIKIQTDGKIVVGGNFTQIAGASRGRIARLNSDGSLDTAFNPSSGANSTIYDLAIQSNGSIVIGGAFSSVNGSNRSYLARLLSDGTTDAAFTATANNFVYAVERQPDDKILIGGIFSQINTIPRYGITRLKVDGTIDINFNNANTNDAVRTIVIQSDKILLGGDFTRINDISAPGIARLLNSAVAARTPFDFDGDGRADVSVFRPSNGVWYLNQSTNGFTGAAFGQAGDKLVPADYDGDGKTDLAVVRNGIWYIQRSSLGFYGVQFGNPDDVPVPADYDGDGKTDVAVFHPSNGYWYLQQSTNGFASIALGLGTDKPVPGDYNGDGRAEVAVFRPSNGTWYLSTNPATGFGGVVFGTSTDVLVPADYDGDGKTDLAVFRPSNGSWYIQRSTAGFIGVQFGLGTDLPVPADYDGDGKADIAVVRNGNWYLNRSTQGFTGITFGFADDKAIPNSFVR